MAVEDACPQAAGAEPTIICPFLRGTPGICARRRRRAGGRAITSGMIAPREPSGTWRDRRAPLAQPVGMRLAHPASGKGAMDARAAEQCGLLETDRDAFARFEPYRF